MKSFIYEKKFNNIFLLFFLFFGNIFISNHNFYFLLIYLFLLIKHLYSFFILYKNQRIQKFEKKNFIFTSLFLFIITYFIICDPNPFFCLISFYIFYPNFIKAVFIIVIHTYFISFYIDNDKNYSINSKNSEDSYFQSKIKYRRNKESYFLSFFFIYLSKKKNNKSLFIGLIAMFITDFIIFLNRIKLWVYFNKKEKTLPISSFKNTTFYITSNVVNIENIADNYIQQLKILINYLGETNSIISIVENGDSKDNTTKYLKDFQNYLTTKNILNKFYLERTIKDPRKIQKPFEKYSRLRIEYFANLRNKALEFLYQIPNLDFNNTIVIFLNDIVFKYEDIINSL